MPPEQRLARFLDGVRRRLIALAALKAGLGAGAAAIVLAGALVALGFSGGGLIRGVVAGFAMIFAVILIFQRSRWRRPADAVESVKPALRNSLVTAGELLRDRTRAKPYIRDLVLSAACAGIEPARPADVFPVRRAALLTSAVIAAAAGMVAFGYARTPAATAPLFGTTAASPVAPAIESIDVVITPPSYTRRPQTRLRNPDRIDLLEGSRISVRVEARADAVDLTAGEQRVRLTSGAGGAFSGSLAVAGETFLTLTPFRNGPGARRLIPLSVTPDAAPAVRVDEPGRDLLLADPAREIAVRVSARDDIGLSTLTLAYTTVSGSGETFAFVEGTLPVAVTRTGERDLSGRGVIRPASLGLAAGDMLVYRAVARDTHPSRGPVESDAFVIEIVSAAEAMAEGFSIDDQRDKYALSQQMVILKTERLIGGRRTMTPQAIAEEAALIAAEQRQVRAEFVFMMGGEVEDEEVEAEQSHEIEAGREQNRGRRDLLAAIRSMSDAAALLMRPDLDQALAAERLALESLQRALTRSRYILRVLAPRERIDDSRRLSGDRTGAGAWRRVTLAAAPDAQASLLHQALRDLSLLARKQAYGADDKATLTGIAERLLRAANADAGLREAAGHLTRASRPDVRDAGDIARLIDAAALAIDAALEAAARAATPPARAGSVSERVRSALADRLRGAAPSRGGGQP